MRSRTPTASSATRCRPGWRTSSARRCSSSSSRRENGSPSTMSKSASPAKPVSEQRSRNMAAIRSKDTKPELALRRALRAAGHVGYRLHARTLPGKPDVVFGPRRVAVFVDGGFWHGPPKRWKPGRYGADWGEKIARHQARDRQVDAELAELGWRVVRVWDFELRKDPDAAVRAVEDALEPSPWKRGGIARASRPVRRRPAARAQTA